MPSAMSLGISLSKNFKNSEEEKIRGMRMILIFSFATPVGIMIGMLIQNSN